MQQVQRTVISLRRIHLTRATRQRLLFVLCIAVSLFLLNNILLGSIVPRLPGGSSYGTTTMFAATVVGMALQKSGHIPIMFLVYGLLGLPSHLFVGDRLYPVSMLLWIFCAVIFDQLVKRQGYSFRGYLISFPFFALLYRLIHFAYLYLVGVADPFATFRISTEGMALVLGYAGIAAAHFCLETRRGHKHLTRLRTEQK